MAIEAQLFLARQMRFMRADSRAFANANLRLDDIDTGDFFRDRVFDLNAWIDLDEIKFVAVGIHQKFDSAGMGVIGGARQFERRFAQRLTLIIV